MHPRKAASELTLAGPPAEFQVLHHYEVAATRAQAAACMHACWPLFGSHMAHPGPHCHPMRHQGPPKPGMFPPGSLMGFGRQWARWSLNGMERGWNGAPPGTEESCP